MKALSECEQMTMKCIWDNGSPITVAEIITALKLKFGKDYKDTTVYTFLSKLREKGYVSSYRKGVTYFEPLVAEETYRTEQIVKSVDFWFDGSMPQYMSAFFKSKKMSKEDAETIRRMIDEFDN